MVGAFVITGLSTGKNKYGGSNTSIRYSNGEVHFAGFSLSNGYFFKAFS